MVRILNKVKLLFFIANHRKLLTLFFYDLNLRKGLHRNFSYV